MSAMLNYKERRLARSRVFRYIFFLISSVRFKSFQSWSQEGEPNPFMSKTYRTVRTERVEFIDIFDDMLNGPGSK